MTNKFLCYSKVELNEILLSCKCEDFFISNIINPLFLVVVNGEYSLWFNKKYPYCCVLFRRKTSLFNRMVYFFDQVSERKF